MTAGPETATGTILGTASYMSPEQAKGKTVDARSDIFSTGAVLYEMLTGKRAFDGDSMAGIMSKVLRDHPPEIRELRADVPQNVADIVRRCLEKDAALRYPSGRELAVDLIGCRPKERAAGSTARSRILIAAALILAICAGGWFYLGNRRTRWVRNEALPQIQSLIARSDPLAAFELARTALSYAPDDPQLKQHWSNISTSLSMTTTPPGATVSYRPFGDVNRPWQLVGQTPIEGVRIPVAHVRLRVEKEGMETSETAMLTAALNGQNIALSPAGKIPPGMVPVSGRPAPWTVSGAAMPLPDFYLDKFEVTNRQFQQFVDAGGYRDPQYWQYPFRKQGRDIPREQALALFLDATGRPGPASWELGAFPKDHAEYPVSGLSWFEAAAYCKYAGKTLPTVHHWRSAAGFGLFSDILLFSNFGGAGPARVGAYSGITPAGAYDMAGNVKEWCQNDTATGDRRYILGGGWNEPNYRYLDMDAQDPLTRSETYGVRCATYPEAVPPAALDPIARLVRDYSTEKPAGDEAFEIFRRMYAYDKAPIDVKTESVDDSNASWRKERVSYTAAYGGERIPAFLYLPKNAAPPYQTVVFVPGGDAFALRNSLTGARTNDFDFLLRTGRAVLYPVYKGTFERPREGTGPNARRDWIIMFAKDVFRSVDFLESRPDIQRNGLAYYGISMGGTFGTLFLALEPRFKTGILVAGGLFASNASPEVDILNFAPRVKLPVLMLNGRLDFQIPFETLQKPMFRWIGTRERDKRQIMFETGHLPPVQDRMRETLNWLDRYVGPVTLTSAPSRSQ